MKAISLWQPWATAVAIGAKRIETRGFATKHRGPLVIHAAQRKNISELIHMHSCWNWQGAMRETGWSWGSDTGEHIRGGFGLPFGALVAVVEVIDCRPVESMTLGEIETKQRPKGDISDGYSWTERQMGNYDLGRFAWILGSVRALPNPIPFKGKQGWFHVPDELVAP